MNKRLIILCIGVLPFLPATAETLYDADTALKSGDTQRALKIVEGLREFFPKNSLEGGQCLLKKAEILCADHRVTEAETLLRGIPSIPGIPSEITREANRRRIKILATKDSRAARVAAKAWLRDNPSGAESAEIRLLLVSILRKEGALGEALNTLSERRMAERKEEFDRPLAAAEAGIRVAIRDKENSRRVSGTPVQEKAAGLMKSAETARENNPKAAAESFAKVAADTAATPALRHRATLAQAECLYEAGDYRAAITAARPLMEFSGDAPAEQIAAGRLFAARLSLDLGENSPRTVSLAQEALAMLPPESDTAEEARWFLARALARAHKPASEIWAALADSPAVKNATRKEDDPRHPVNRLIAASGNLDKWIEGDLHQSAPAGATALLRAADECFAATRYTEAAKRYAKAETYAAPSGEVRAYAALQRARAVALSANYSDAPMLYRRFLTDKALSKSAYAPSALLRAGTLCEGRLRDTKQAREFFRLGYDKYPSTEPGQACLIYLAESFADSGDKKTAVSLYEAYLKKYPDSHHTGAAKNFLNDIKTPKKK